MYKSTVLIALGIALFFTCILAFSLQAATVSENEPFASTIQSELIGAAIAYTDTITATIALSDTEIIFQGLADAARSAEILRFSGVDGLPISIYDPVKYKIYQIREQALAEICPMCIEPECPTITCPIPIPSCLLSCCIPGKPCMIGPTSVLERDYGQLRIPEAVIFEYSEQVIKAVEHFRQYQ